MRYTAEEQEYYDKEILRAYRRLIRAMPNTSRVEKKDVRRAFEYARDAHRGVRRKSGEPYILHPLAVALIVVKEIGLEDVVSVQSALLHDVVEDTEIELKDIRREFGNTAANIIDGLTKITEPALIDQMTSKQAENFRKILLTISDDIRVVLIKLADRLHNMRTIGAMRRESMLKISSETLYIYAPLAHRLGLYEIKTELENLAFKFSQPAIYEELERKMLANQEEANAYIERFSRGIRHALRNSGLKFTVKSRFKTIYSVYLKMINKNLPFEEIYDRYAVRIILETREGREREDCWLVYSIISGMYRPNPKRLRDWITMPKENGYESLHTTLLGPEGRWVEVQIRTTRMDDIAEKGIAAHWKYKEDGEKYDEYMAEWIGQIRQILENPSLTALEAVREFKENLQPNDIFVFTPKGEMVRLPHQATALDLAYKIHSNIGDTAIGAKVNHQVETLDYRLRPGDQVEILTSRKQQPRREWLRFAVTQRARDRIRTALRRDRREAIEQGRMLFLWRARQYNIDENHPYFKELLAYFMKPSAEEFFYALGSRKIDTKRITEFIRMKKEGRQLDTRYLDEWEKKQKRVDNHLQKLGMDTDLLVVGKEQEIDNYVLAPCCEPLPGDEILGFDQGNRVEIHRTSCEEAIRLMSSFGSRIIKVKWSSSGKTDVAFLAALRVVGLDKQGMLNDLIKIISMQMKLNIRKVTIESNEGMFEGLFHLYVHNTEELNELIARIENIPHVYTVTRTEQQLEPLVEETEG